MRYFIYWLDQGQNWSNPIKTKKLNNPHLLHELTVVFYLKNNCIRFYKGNKNRSHTLKKKGKTVGN
jgi:hypothetical protein